MIKTLEKLGDRLLTRFVPKVEAAAGATGIYCGCVAGQALGSARSTTP